MAELALLASIVQIADTGYRLSLKLYTTGEAISSADRAIITISKDISLTSTVLKELGQILGRDEDERERISSDNLVQTAGDTVKQCLDVFEEIDKMILKNMPNLSQGNKGTRATMALERLKWPFIQPRIQLLKGSLDMLRANISLMLNVLIYARHKSERKKLRAPGPTAYNEASQKTIIEELHNAKEEYVRKFESLKLSVPASPSTQQVHNKDMAAAARTEENLVPTEHTFDSVSATTFRDAPAPQYTLNPSSTTTFKSAPRSQHTFLPFPASTVQNTPLPQWPLPDILASYPITSKDPVTFPPDEDNPWAILHHFDTLVKNLVREVYSPDYQIPVESRSRFTGAIAETHRLEVVEAKISKAIKITPYSSVSGTPQYYLRPPPLQQPLCSPNAYSIPEIQGSLKSSTRTRKRRISQTDIMRAEQPRHRTGHSPELDTRGYACQAPARYLTQSIQEASKSDVVEDLLKLWTVV